MLCDKFKCVFLVLDEDTGEEECEPAGSGGCLGDLCDVWGDCSNCQQLPEEQCEGLKK